MSLKRLLTAREALLSALKLGGPSEIFCTNCDFPSATYDPSGDVESKLEWVSLKFTDHMLQTGHKLEFRKMK